MPLTYSKYLKLDQLLSIQEPLSEGPEHDEMLFIIIHQVYELWFKEVLHEVDHLADCWKKNEETQGLHTLKRVLKILKILVAQIDVLETMTPLEFQAFRHRLESASGFQSHQFRELEFILGCKQQRTLDFFPEKSREHCRLKARFLEPGLWDVFLHFLSRRGYDIPESLLNRDVTNAAPPSPEVQRTLIGLYRGDPRLSEVCELLVDLDEGIQEWRYRHVKMVERTIGTHTGTGGSSGAAYLKTTLFKPVFPDLWAIRSSF